MSLLRYDSDSDSLYVNVSSKKAYLSMEISQRIAVDLSESKKVVGVEILDASKVLSGLFHKIVSKSKLKNLLCSVSEDDAIYLNFKLENKRASLALPKAYKSPLLATSA